MATSAIAAIRRKCISRSASRRTDSGSAARPRSISSTTTRCAIYTTPQTNKNTLSQYDLNATFTPAPNWKILTDVHYRAFDQAHVDGNTTDLNSCGQPTLCDGNGKFDLSARYFPGAANLGVIDRTWTRSRTVGGTVQIENTDKIYSMPNKFTFGVNYEHGWTNFSPTRKSAF